MAYADFSSESIAIGLGLTLEWVDLFPELIAIPEPDWLKDTLIRGRRQALLSEKARGEFLVVPILLACEELVARPVTIYSGQRLDVDPGRNLVGECDYILAATPPHPSLRAPLITIVEAKKNDVEGGIYQCIAQMEGARVFNEKAGDPAREVYGCVTNGEAWQFLRLIDAIATVDLRRYYINNVGEILAALGTILRKAGAA